MSDPVLHLPLDEAEAPPGGPARARRFDGEGLTLPAADTPALGTGDFTIDLWLHAGGDGGTVGDLVSRFDPVSGRGFSLSCVSNSGVTSTSQANLRGLQFGIDAGRLPDAADPAAGDLVMQPSPWIDRGRPGAAVHVAALHTSAGDLFAGTFEIEAGERGHLWRYGGGDLWHDLGGTPDGSSVVDAIARFDGGLYCGTGRYMPMGSALGATRNDRPGGTVWRVDGDGGWVDCGRPGGEDATPEEVEVPGYDTGKADQASALTVFEGRLYCTSFHRRGAFVYEGGKDWRCVGPGERLISFAVFEGNLLALVNGGPVLRYAGGESWEPWGHPEGSTQTYSAAVYGDRLHVGTWPTGTVHRRGEDGGWTELTRPGYEREIMAMAVCNQKLYVGGLPMGNVYRHDPDGRGGAAFTFAGTLDATPGALLRRVWSMSVYDGQLFAGTLPSGRVWSLRAGAMATFDDVLSPGWHHLAAVRRSGRLELFVDGEPAGRSAAFSPGDYDVDAGVPLRIGAGCHAGLRGWLADVRIHDRALSAGEVTAARGRAGLPR